MFVVLINFIILEPEQWIFLNQMIHILNSSTSSSPYFIIQKKELMVSPIKRPHQVPGL